MAERPDQEVVADIVVDLGEAERLQQEAMHELAGPSAMGAPAPSLEAAARANIETYAATCGRAFPSPTTETLLAALGRLGCNPEE